MKNQFVCLIIMTFPLLVTQPASAVESSKQTTYLQKVVKTAKERLGKKASDEQRVNNCKVPVEQRGSKQRPDKCA